MLTVAHPAGAITYQTSAGVAAGQTGGSYTGVGTVNIMTANTANVHEAGTCTGTLVSLNVVITAAHCVATEPDLVTGLIFDLPSYGERTEASTYYAVAGSWVIHEDYEEKGIDIAMFTLTTEATGHEVYEIYEGDPIDKEFTRVGTGTTGGAEGTYSGIDEQEWKQQEGKNTFEYHGNEVRSYNSANSLISDFDDGTAEHDVFGVTKGKSQTGVEGESLGSKGDSGSPTFIDGKIVGVLSGVASGSVLTVADCTTPGNVDPYKSEKGECANSSVGDLNSDIWLKPYTKWINDYIDAASVVPEPSTWSMMLLGFGAMAIGLRRRPRGAAVRQRSRA